MRVDVHTHFLPGPYRDLLSELGNTVRIERRPDAEYVVSERGTFEVTPGFTDVDARVGWMDEHGLDRTLLSVSTPKAPNPSQGPFSVSESVELTRAINDGFADVQRAHPDRVAALGMLPLRDPDAAVDELDRIADLGLAGVSLPTTLRGRKLSEPALEPVFDALDDSGLAAFMHPKTNGLSGDLESDEGRFNPMVVYPTETAMQVARLIFDGFFDRHDFDLVLAHMGGALPFLAGRLERGREQFYADGPPARPVVEYLRELYYDTISFHPPSMRAVIDTVGADHLLLGSDYPFGMEKIGDTLADVDSLDLSEEERERMLGDTAADLFDLDG